MIKAGIELYVDDRKLNASITKATTEFKRLSAQAKNTESDSQKEFGKTLGILSRLEQKARDLQKALQQSTSINQIRSLNAELYKTEQTMAKLRQTGRPGTGIIGSGSGGFQSAIAGSLTGYALGFVGIQQTVGFFNEAIDASNRYQNALIGLNSVGAKLGVSQGGLNEAVQTLIADGLLTATEAAGGLKNLLASGFGLQEAIRLMNVFKDSASFNRQAALGFGEAIVSATEGIKNGNSILVDNAGITKNLSKILEEAGMSAQDLNKATSDANVRQALYNGLIKEGNLFLGDAAKLTQTYSGQVSQMSAYWERAKQSIGEFLKDAISASGVMDTLKNRLEFFNRLTQEGDTRGFLGNLLYQTGFTVQGQLLLSDSEKTRANKKQFKTLWEFLNQFGGDISSTSDSEKQLEQLMTKIRDFQKEFNEAFLLSLDPLAGHKRKELEKYLKELEAMRSETQVGSQKDRLLSAQIERIREAMNPKKTKAVPLGDVRQSEAVALWSLRGPSKPGEVTLPKMTRELSEDLQKENERLAEQDRLQQQKDFERWFELREEKRKIEEEDQKIRLSNAKELVNFYMDVFSPVEDLLVDAFVENSKIGFKEIEAAGKQMIKNLLRQIIHSGLLTIFSNIVGAATGTPSLQGPKGIFKLLGFSKGAESIQGPNYDSIPFGILQGGESVLTPRATLTMQRTFGVGGITHLNATGELPQNAGFRAFRNGVENLQPNQSQKTDTIIIRQYLDSVLVEERRVKIGTPYYASNNF